MTDTLIDPARSALLLVDLQERLLPAIDGGEQVVAAADWLAGVAHELELPIHATEQYPERLGATAGPVARWVPASQCHTKMHFSWAQDPSRAGVRLPEQVIIAGTEAHVCVLQTALGLQQLGHQVFAVAEAVGSRRAADRDLALARMRQAGVVIVGAEMVAFEWLQRAGTETFRRLLPCLREGWQPTA
ncbi:isochorismatase family protein [Halorhodospira halophila]|uniref:Isochorismatase hydrolase n=1 Tax=Halorhodospira halophila (strain DSM 244 / SL1) TaxID=349124 RepID=A1WZ23_HALHL|nr:isochorismatase family protein [Halorhodospira halophila]ABM62935.1 isochorismatase hydrolase [Halorhodospira halophila SL1]MBK1727944.1 hydrolase [Halorhodospira halophila]